MASMKQCEVTFYLKDTVKSIEELLIQIEEELGKIEIDLDISKSSLDIIEEKDKKCNKMIQTVHFNHNHYTSEDVLQLSIKKHLIIRLPNKFAHKIMYIPSWCYHQNPLRNSDFQEKKQIVLNIVSEKYRKELKQKEDILIAKKLIADNKVKEELLVQKEKEVNQKEISLKEREESLNQRVEQYQKKLELVSKLQLDEKLESGFESTIFLNQISDECVQKIKVLLNKEQIE